jgi:hypothetical protein
LLESHFQYFRFNVFVLLRQVKEGLEDKKRHEQDHKVNNRLAEVLCPEGTSKGGASGGNSPTIEVSTSAFACA